jgi:hypothetical protein
MADVVSVTPTTAREPWRWRLSWAQLGMFALIAVFAF